MKTNHTVTESLLALEPRVMFDAAALLTGAEVSQEADATQTTDAEPGDTEHEQAQTAAAQQDSLRKVVDSFGFPAERRELVFIDTSVNDYQTLMAGISSNAEVILLDSTRDGLEQIAAILQDYTDIDAIHLISHGNQGELRLGTGTLTVESMTNEYANELSIINQALNADADFLIYGCNFGEGQVGQNAAIRLAQLTGADIAASQDLTGDTALGGDWELEYQTGSIETAIVVNEIAQQEFSGVLGPTPPVIANFGGDSLTYTEGDGAQVIDQSSNATVTDSDSSDFDTGTLTVSVTAGSDSTEDVLGIQNQGTSSGQIGVSGFAVTYEGITIGTFTGGTSGTNLVITFDSNATPTAVSALVQNITYENTDTENPTTTSRTVRSVLTDGDGGTSANYDTTVTVIDANDAPTFDVGDGTVTTTIGSGDDIGQSVAVQADGKILVGGYTATAITPDSTEWDFSLTRYNTDGTLDTSFGGGDGIVTTDLGSTNFDRSHSIIIQADGKILLAGESYIGAGKHLALVRYNSDGTLDTSFGGGDGIVRTTVAFLELGESVTLQSDGKILVTGSSFTGGSNTDILLVRYNTDGTLDTSFGGGDGIVTTAIGSGLDSGHSVTVQTDGKILVWGQGNTGSKLDFTLLRYNADGTLDTSFGGGDGIVTTAVSDGTRSDFGETVTVLSDGKILASGSLTTSGGGADFVLLKYNADGTLDTSFGGGDGIVITTGDAAAEALDMVVQPDGKILIAGYGGNSTDKFSVARYLADGTVDTTFGGGTGIVNTEITSGVDRAYSMALQTDGKILLAGKSSNGSNADFALARYNSDGTLDTSFALMATLDGNPSFTEDGAAMVLDVDVQISDSELDALNSGNGNYAGASLTLVRNGGASSEDVLSFIDDNGITLSGGNLIKNSQIIASFDSTTTAGQLVITFTDVNGETPTSSDVDTILRQLTYTNSSDAPPASAQIDWTFNDGNTGSQGTGSALTDTGSTTVNITAVNDNPVNSMPSNEFTALNTAVVFSSGNSNLISISDVDASSSDLEVTLTVTNGTLTLAGTTGLSFTIGNGTSDSTMTFTGTVSEINTALEGLRFDPTTSFRGLAQLTLATDDQGFTGSGGAKTDTDTVDIHVGAIVVTNTTDTSNGTVTSKEALVGNDGGDGVSLREAIEVANTEDGTDYIYFQISDALVGGAHTIAVGASGLDSITETVIIDGTTDSDFSSTPIIELDGSATGVGIEGLFLASGSDGSTIRGLVINQFADDGIQIVSDNNTIVGNYIGTDVTGTIDLGNNDDGIDISGANNTIGGTTSADRNIISGNAFDGIEIDEAGATGNIITGNYIGTDVTGTLDLGNSDDGVQLSGAASSNTIGGTTAATRNIISGNDSRGFDIYGSGTSSNIIQGNYIGVDVTGTADLGNTDQGILIDTQSTNNTIGGATAGAGNVISGNNSYGVEIDGSGTTGNTILGNYIGTNAAGTSAIGNTGTGIRIDNSASSNTIGGTTTSARNVISGNTGDGIYITDSGTDSNVIQGNFIGTTAAGTAALANTNRGIQIEANAANTQIGGTAAGAGNVISGNTSDGIILSGLSSGTIVEGNFIGTDLTGTINIGNGGSGVRITTGTNNTIGGTASDAGNTIAYNSQDGITLDNSAGTGNSLLRNLIHSNSGIGIDIDNDGVTANDAGDSDTGANALQNFPVLTTANIESGSEVTITGSLNSTASTDFRIEFFRNTVATGQDGSEYGEGEDYLGFVDITTDGSGNATINTTLSAAVLAGEFITATATISLGSGNYGNTSEFGLNIVAVDFNDVPVITSNGGGTIANVNVTEGTTFVTTVTGTDADLPGDTLSYSLVGGADAGRFTINSRTGALTFKTTPDFENPHDTNADNQYVVQIQVNDGNGGTDLQSLVVNVTNIIEALPPLPESETEREVQSEQEPDTEESLDISDSPSPSTNTGTQGPISPVVLTNGTTQDHMADKSGTAFRIGRELNHQFASLSVSQARDLTSAHTLGLSDSLSGPMRTFDLRYSTPTIPIGLEQQLDALAERLQDTVQQDQIDSKIISGVTTGTGLTLSAGYVAWMLRGTSLLTSLMASLPAWGNFDPLPILTGGYTARKAGEEGNKAEMNKENSEHQGLDEIFRDSEQD